MFAPDLNIAVAQLNPVVGDVAGNVARIRETYRDADDRGADLVVTPELSVTGCPLDDLAYCPDLLAAARAGLHVLRQTTRGRKAALVVGAPVREENGICSAVMVFRNGSLLKLMRKTNQFNPGNAIPFALGEHRVGLLIHGDERHTGTSRELRDNGAEIIISINASPFRPGALRARVHDAAARQVAETGLPFLYVNMTGGQDEVVFDGGSFFMDSDGRRAFQMPQWEECVMDFNPAETPLPADVSFPDALESVWRAMMTGVGDYVGKNRFTDVVLGLSGGMDSALVAAVAGDVLGPGRVHCVRLPSRYTADLSNAAAEEMCRLWGFPLLTLPIGNVVKAAAETLAPSVPDGLGKLASENMQARARGYLLMTLSNQYNWLLLATGNKSEISVGYCTLYGDMCGGFNPLKDVFKTTVFDLARWRNRNRPDGFLGPDGTVIPQDIIERPPSAELAPEQKDSDSLPPYDVLDAILEEMVDKRTPLAEIVARGFDKATVERVHRLLMMAEYKRRQSAPGLKASFRAFARAGHAPMVNGFHAGMIDRLIGMVD